MPDAAHVKKLQNLSNIHLISVGLASVLTVFGVLFIHTSKLFQQIPESGRLFRILPVASALFIALVGIVISWHAYADEDVRRGVAYMIVFHCFSIAL